MNTEHEQQEARDRVRVLSVLGDDLVPLGAVATLANLQQIRIAAALFTLCQEGQAKQIGRLYRRAPFVVDARTAQGIADVLKQRDAVLPAGE